MLAYFWLNTAWQNQTIKKDAKRKPIRQGESLGGFLGITRKIL
jgi:hypothetical protein